MCNHFPSSLWAWNVMSFIDLDHSDRSKTKSLNNIFLFPRGLRMLTHLRVLNHLSFIFYKHAFQFYNSLLWNRLICFLVVHFAGNAEKGGSLVCGKLWNLNHCEASGYYESTSRKKTHSVIWNKKIIIPGHHERTTKIGNYIISLVF